MQDVVHHVLVFFLDTVAGNAVAAVFQQLRHNLALYLLVVMLGILAVHHLLLQFAQLLTAVFISRQFLNSLAQLRVNILSAVVQGEYPSHQGSLTHQLVAGKTVDVGQQSELVVVKEVQGRQRDGTHNELLVATVDSR